MLQKYSNVADVPLSLAVFLATDNYDYVNDPTTISATSLIKPVRQIILQSRVPEAFAVEDLPQMMASRMGSAIHDAIERSWKQNHGTAMAALGFPQKVIDRIRVNPSEAELFDGCIPVYLEQRKSRKIGKYTITGKFDFVGDGQVEDFKSTSTYTYMKHTNDEKYILQGSIYRWLNPEIITKDQMAIRFIFTDWSAAKAKSEPGYPPRRFATFTFGLKSIAETESYIRNKLALIEKLWDAPEDQIPECTDAELWRSAPVYKYYKNPAKTTRSTKNFDTLQDAMARLVEDHNVGIVREQPGQVTACKYCPAFAVCSQKDRLIASGDLII